MLKDISVKTNYEPLIITVRKKSKDDEAIVHEIFNENVYRLHDNFFAEDGVVLDVGANIGIFTLDVLLRAKNNDKAVTIYAFEPEPHNLELLQKNLDQNNWIFGDSNVIIITEAISDKIDLAYIDDNHGSSRLSTKGSLIQTTTLDRFVEDEKIDKISFAKFDIEGSEVPSLLAASDETLDKIRRCAIEFDEHNGLDKFAELINRFARNCQINTLGVPARGCYIYTERFDI